MSTVPSREVPISTLETAIDAAQALNYDTVCIGQLNSDIVVGKDIGSTPGPRELEGEAVTKEGDDINVQ